MLAAMPITTPSRTLHIPIDDRELTVRVDGDAALLDLVPARRHVADDASGPDPAHSGPDAAIPGPDADGSEPVSIRVPARALVAALRVAWADEHDLRCFEPWRDVTPNGRWNGYREHDRYGYAYGGYGDDGRRWFDDLDDGDPDGYRDPTVVPFPRPAPTPRPSRAYQPWEQDEEEKLREMWLAADPGTDRSELMRQIAEGLERPPGGILMRLTVVGCDPARPGRRRFEPDDELATAEAGEPGHADGPTAVDHVQ